MSELDLSRGCFENLSNCDISDINNEQLKKIQTDVLELEQNFQENFATIITNHFKRLYAEKTIVDINQLITVRDFIINIDNKVLRPTFISSFNRNCYIILGMIEAGYEVYLNNDNGQIVSSSKKKEKLESIGVTFTTINKENPLEKKTFHEALIKSAFDFPEISHLKSLSFSYAFVAFFAYFNKDLVSITHSKYNHNIDSFFQTSLESLDNLPAIVSKYYEYNNEIAKVLYSQIPDKSNMMHILETHFSFQLKTDFKEMAEPFETLKNRLALKKLAEQKPNDLFDKLLNTSIKFNSNYTKSASNDKLKNQLLQKIQNLPEIDTQTHSLSQFKNYQLNLQFLMDLQRKDLHNDQSRILTEKKRDLSDKLSIVLVDKLISQNNIFAKKAESNYESTPSDNNESGFGEYMVVRNQLASLTRGGPSSHNQYLQSQLLNKIQNTSFEHVPIKERFITQFYVTSELFSLIIPYSIINKPSTINNTIDHLFTIKSNGAASEFIITFQSDDKTLKEISNAELLKLVITAFLSSNDIDQNLLMLESSFKELCLLTKMEKDGNKVSVAKEYSRLKI